MFGKRNVQENVVATQFVVSLHTVVITTKRTFFSHAPYVNILVILCYYNKATDVS